MKQKYFLTFLALFILGSLSSLSFAQSSIFSPGMNITPNGSVDSPTSEDFSKIIDGNISTKFLDFNYSDGMGFTVYMGGDSYVATQIEITTANDSPNRDPRNFHILGSNNGSSFSTVATGSIPCISSRFSKRTFSFSNTDAYTHYRINFTNQCGTDNSLQLAEVQLIGSKTDPNQPPVAVCKHFIAQLGEDGTVTITPSNVDGGSSDDKTGYTVSINKNTFDCLNIGNNQVELSITDSDGETDSCIATVTVEDKEAPTAISKDITVELDANAQANITAAMVNNSSTDNCTAAGDLNLSLDYSIFTCENVGDKGKAINASSLNFDGNDLVSIPDDPSLRLTGDMAMEAWFKVDAFNADWVRIVGKGSGSSGGSLSDPRNYGLWYHPGGTWLFQQYGDGVQVSFNQSIDIDEWYHIAAVKTGNVGKLYINGELVASNTGGTNPVTSADPLTIGYAGFHTYHIGQIDEVRVWNTGRTDEEIQENYNRTLDPETDGLLAYYNMEEAEGINLNDLSGNGHNGSLQEFSQTNVWTTSSENLGPENIVTLIVRDENGNESTAKASVTVLDNTPPAVETKDITVELDETGNTSITPAMVIQNSSDNCGIESSVLNVSDFTLDEVGENTVTLTVTDVNGNETIVTALVTVKDVTAPTGYSVKIDQTEIDDTNQTALSFTFADAEVGTTYDYTISSSGGLDVVRETGTVTSATDQITGIDVSSLEDGTLTLSVTLTDSSDNIGEAATSEVLKATNTPPTAVCQNFIAELGADGTVMLMAEDIDGGSSDVEGDVTLSIDLTEAYTCHDIGDHEVTLTVTDSEGETDTCIATVTVADKSAPVVSTQDVTIYLDEDGQASIRGDYSVGMVAGELEAQNSSSTDTPVDCDCPDGYVAVGYEGATGWIMDDFRLLCKEVLADGSLGTETIETCFSGSNTSVYRSDIMTGNEVLVGFEVKDGDYQYQLSSRTHVGVKGIGKNLQQIANGELNEIENTMLPGLTGSGTATTNLNTTTQLAPTGHAIVGMSVNQTTGYSSTVSFKYAPIFSLLSIDNGSTDNCGISSITVDRSEFTCEDLGENPVTLTVVDNYGNEATATATVNVMDKIVPVVAAKDFTVQLDANGEASISVSDVNDGTTDNCGITNLAINENSFSCEHINNPRNYSLNFEATNGYTITEDASSAISGSNTITLEGWVYPKNSGYYQFLMGYRNDTDADFYMLQRPDNTIEARFRNADGTMYDMRVGSLSLNEWQHLALSFDGTALTLYVNGEIESSIAAIGNFKVSDFENFYMGASDRGGANFYFSGNLEDVRLWNKTRSQTEIQSAMISSISGSETDLAINYGFADGSGSTVTDQSGNGLNAGFFNMDETTTWIEDSPTISENIVVLTATDVNGNVSSATATVSVVDKIAAEILTQDIAIQLDKNGMTSIEVSDIDNGSNDACGIESLELDITEFTCDNLGANTVTLTAKDVNGNVSSETAVVTVEDKVAAEVLTQDITIQLDENGMATIEVADIDTGSNDACGIESLELDMTEFTCENVGPNTVTLTAKDVNGNVSSETATVTVEDKVAAEVLTKDITVQLDAEGKASIEVLDIDNGSNDACGIESLELDMTGFTCENVGPNTVTLSAKDINGNESSETATVTVEDNVAAEVLTQDITIQLDANGMASIEVSDIDNGSNDACGIESLELDVKEFTCDHVGANTVTLTTKDVNGNVSLETATVIVEDNVVAEVLTKDITVQLDAEGKASIEVADIDNGSNDVCGIESLELDMKEFTCDHVGANTVTLTAKDVNGNVSSKTAIVTVEDNVAAEVLTQDITIQLDENGMASIEVSDIDNGSNDTCGIESLELDMTEFTCDHVGANTVTLTAKDVNGNVSSETATVTVEDDIAPVPVMESLAPIYAECLVEKADVVKPMAVDNCDNVTVSADLYFPITRQGSTMITWKYEDAAGNKTYQQQEIIIEDTTAPVADVTDLEKIEVECGISGITAPTATDNCAGAITGTTSNDLSYSEQGEYNITWTYDDGNGNVTNQDQLVIVKDITAPEVFARDITVYLDPRENVTITPEDIDAGSFDNCSEVSLELDQYYFERQGTYEVTLSATDAVGNTGTVTAIVTVEIDAVDTEDAHVVPTLLKRNSKANVILPFRSGIARVEVIETETNKFKSFNGNKKNKMEIDVAPFKGTLLVRITDTDGKVYLKKLVAF